MQSAILNRIDEGGDCTLGLLHVDGEVYATLERPWKDNARNISSIPAGDYRATYLERSASGKYRQVYHVRPVDGRSGILIHAGNLVAHTRGCILIGLRHGRLAGEKAVLNSRSGLRKLREQIGQQAFALIVRGEQDA